MIISIDHFFLKGIFLLTAKVQMLSSYTKHTKPFIATFLNQRMRMNVYFQCYILKKTCLRERSFATIDLAVSIVFTLQNHMTWGHDFQPIPSESRV